MWLLKALVVLVEGKSHLQLVDGREMSSLLHVVGRKDLVSQESGVLSQIADWQVNLLLQRASRLIPG